MSAQPLLARTACHLYLIRQSDVLTIRTVSADGAIQVADPLRRPCTLVELGPLLDPADQSTQARHRALIVPFRRRLVALLVDSVDAIDAPLTVAPIPELLRTRMLQPWSSGAALVGDHLVAQLDLRAIALSCSGAAALPAARAA